MGRSVKLRIVGWGIAAVIGLAFWVSLGWGIVALVTR